jgi:drug/metabolite transporter (DMT)-like permease
VSRPVVWSLCASLVVVWSSTWVAIRLGLDDTPPLLGAGVRFTLGGAGSRLVLGLMVAVAGLAVAFSESLALGHGSRALPAAAAMLVAPMASAGGNVAIRRRARGLDPLVLNGWAMLAAGLLLLAVSAPVEAWGDAAWTPKAFGAITYLALVGSAFTFVVLTILVGELGALKMSVLPLLLPFGALLFGAAIDGEALTPTAAAGAVLVAGGLLVGQWPARRRARVPA